MRKKKTIILSGTRIFFFIHIIAVLEENQAFK